MIHFLVSFFDFLHQICHKCKNPHRPSGFSLRFGNFGSHPVFQEEAGSIDGLVVGVVVAAVVGLGDHCLLVVGGGRELREHGRRRRRVRRRRDGVTVRGVQVPAAQVPAGLRVRALLPAGQPAEVRARAPRVRREQRHQAAERAPPLPAGGRRELARVRGRHAPPRPRLRLRRRHLRPPAPAPPAPARPLPRPLRALQIPGGGGGGGGVVVERAGGGDGGLHRKHGAELHSELHQRRQPHGGGGDRRGGRWVRARPPVLHRADAGQELRRGERGGEARRCERERRRVRVRVLVRHGRRRADVRARAARRRDVPQARHRRRRRAAHRRAVAVRAACSASIFALGR